MEAVLYSSAPLLIYGVMSLIQALFSYTSRLQRNYQWGSNDYHKLQDHFFVLLDEISLPEQVYREDVIQDDPVMDSLSHGILTAGMPHPQQKPAEMQMILTCLEFEERNSEQYFEGAALKIDRINRALKLYDSQNKEIQRRLEGLERELESQRAAHEEALSVCLVLSSTVFLLLFL